MMGYSYGYGRNGRLVLSCDNCGKAEGRTRKRPCPSGYCPAPAICPECWKLGKGKHTAEQAAECKKYHDAYEAEQKRERDLIESGVPVRCSAMGYFDGTGRVRVIFAVKDGHVGYNMNERTYDAIPLGTVATVDDYKAKAQEFGDAVLMPAPANYDDVHATRDRDVDANRRVA